jgi:hypothetical protein
MPDHTGTGAAIPAPYLHDTWLYALDDLSQVG